LRINRLIIVIFAIAIIGFVIYSNTLNAEFQFDSKDSIVENPSIKGFSNFDFRGNHHGTRTFSYITFTINYYLGGLNTFGYHIFNISIHIAAAVLIFFLVQLLFKTPKLKENSLTGYKDIIAFFSATLFLVHPVQSQAVTYIVQRITSLAAFFYLLTVIFYARARIYKSRLYYILAIIISLIGTLTKENIATLPLSVFLFEITFFGISKKNFKRKLKYIVPFFLPLLIIFLLLLTDLDNLNEITRETVDISRVQYLLTQFNVIRTYLRLLFIPINQNLDYDYLLSKNFLETETILSFFLILTIIILALRIFKKYRLISFGILWFFITLSVESGIVPIKDVIFEHRLYLPTMGFGIFLSSVISLMIKDKKKIAIFLSIIVLGFSFITYNRNKVWRTEISLWEDVVKKSPNKARPHNNLGLAYKEKGMFDKAIEEYEKVLDIDSGYVDAHNNLGIVYMKRGKLNDAERKFRKILEIDPEYYKAYHNLGIIYAQKGWFDKAIPNFKKSLQINSHYAETYNNLGLVYGSRNKYREAVSAFKKAAILKPKNGEIRYNLGITYGKMRKFDEAVTELEKTIQFNPESIKAYRSLVIIYNYRGNKLKALEQTDKLRKLGKEDIANKLEKAILSNINY